MKRYGDMPTHIDLTDKARHVYNNWSPIDIYEVRDFTDDGEPYYRYQMNLCGERYGNLTDGEVNAILESWADEVQFENDHDNAVGIFLDGLYDQAVELMDDDIREELHRRLSPCGEVEFLTEYIKAHREKYGEEFEV